MRILISVLAASLLLAPAFTQTVASGNCDPSVAGTCKACYNPAGTTTATSKDCRRCANGFALTFNTATPPAGSCTICGDGTGRAGDSVDQTTAQPCAGTATSPCNVFGSSPTACVNCVAGFYFVAGNTCTACPSGRSKAKDTAGVMPTAAGQENTACYFVCPNGQATCANIATAPASSNNTSNTTGNNSSAKSATLLQACSIALVAYALF